MSDKKAQISSPAPETTDASSRRAALAKLLTSAGVVAGSAALPEQWIRPVVSTLVLPAHAGTSASCSIDSFSIGGGESTTGGVEVHVGLTVTGLEPNSTSEAIVTSSALESTFIQNIEADGTGFAFVETNTPAESTEGSGNEFEYNASVECDGGPATSETEFSFTPV